MTLPAAHIHPDGSVTYAASPAVTVPAERLSLLITLLQDHLPPGQTVTVTDTRGTLTLACRPDGTLAVTTNGTLHVPAAHREVFVEGLRAARVIAFR